MSLSEWIALAAAIAAIVSAVIAAVEARSARQSGAIAAEALARLAEAQEQVAESTRRAAWGVPKRLRENVWAVRNTSGQRMEVRLVSTMPRVGTMILRPFEKAPITVESGELLRLRVQENFLTQVALESFTIVWKFSEGDGIERKSTRTLY